jgi:hypothetical protein
VPQIPFPLSCQIAATEYPMLVDPIWSGLKCNGVAIYSKGAEEWWLSYTNPELTGLSKVLRTSSFLTIDCPRRVTHFSAKIGANQIPFYTFNLNL